MISPSRGICKNCSIQELLAPTLPEGEDSVSPFLLAISTHHRGPSVLSSFCILLQILPLLLYLPRHCFHAVLSNGCLKILAYRFICLFSEKKKKNKKKTSGLIYKLFPESDLLQINLRLSVATSPGFSSSTSFDIISWSQHPNSIKLAAISWRSFSFHLIRTPFWVYCPWTQVFLR